MNIVRVRRARWIGGSILVAIIVVAGSVGVESPAGAVTSTTSFTEPGQAGFTVPDGVTSITVVAVGAAGGDGSGGDDGGSGGSGAVVTAELPVTAGDYFAGFIGAQGDLVAGGLQNGGNPGGSTGGNPGGGGGGSTVLFGLDDTPILVAGGGGGGGAGGDFGGGYDGGDAGGLTGGNGEASGGGYGGTQSAPGFGGSPDGEIEEGFAGNGQFGGQGGGGLDYGGGGGGGGYFGGGGGGAGYGGGAGSSFADPDATDTVTFTTAAVGAGASLSFSYVVPARTITVAASATTVPVGGSTLEVTATLETAAGAPVIGANVTFDSTDSTQEIGATVDNGDGTYTAAIVSGEFRGAVTITANDRSATPLLSGTTVVTQFVGPPDSVAVQLQPTSVLADGTSTVDAIATVRDEWGNWIAGETVVISSSEPAQRVSAVTDNGDGTYTASVTATTAIESVTISATVTSVFPLLIDTGILTQVAGPASAMQIVVSPSSVPSTATGVIAVTVTVLDAFGAGLSGERVQIVTGGSNVGNVPVVDSGGGTYTASIPVGLSAEPLAIAAVTASSAPPLAVADVVARPVPAPEPPPYPRPSPTRSPEPIPSVNPGQGDAGVRPTATATPTAPTPGPSPMPVAGGEASGDAESSSTNSSLADPLVWVLIAVSLGGGYLIRSLLQPRRLP